MTTMTLIPRRNGTYTIRSGQHRVRVTRDGSPVTGTMNQSAARIAELEADLAAVKAERDALREAARMAIHSLGGGDRAMDDAKYLVADANDVAHSLAAALDAAGGE